MKKFILLVSVFFLVLFFNLTEAFILTSPTIADIMFGGESLENSTYGVQLDAPILYMDFNNGPENLSSNEFNDYIQDNSIFGNYGSLNSTNSTSNPIYNSSCTAYTGSGGCYEFDGSDDYIDINSAIPDLASTKTGTWSAWIKPVNKDPSTDQAIISFGDTNANARLYMSIENSGQGYFRVLATNSGVGKWILDSDTNPFTNNAWTHIALVQDGVEPVIYVDGVAVAQTFSFNGDKTWWFSDDSGLDNGRIGDANFFNSGERDLFNGKIDDVLILDRAMSSNEILNLYNNNSAKFGKYSNQGDFTSDIFYNDTAGYWNISLEIASGGYSSEATQVINRFTNLEDYEKDAIATFVDAEVANGNWELIDEFFLFKLHNETDALIGLKGLKNATNNGATKIHEGFSFDGVNDWIDTNFSPLNDGINFKQDDAILSIFTFNDSNLSDQRGIFGGGTTVGTGATWFYRQGSVYRAKFNRDAVSIFSTSVKSTPSLKSLVRKIEGSVDLYINGDFSSSTLVASDGLSGPNFLVGRTGGLYAKENVSSFMIGAAVGFNHSAHYENIQNLLDSLENNLVSYYDLDGNMLDSKGSNDGTCSGTTCPVNSTGLSSGAMMFDGVDDYINITSAVNSLSSTTTGTWSAWVKPVDATPSAGNIILSISVSSSSRTINLNMLTTGKLRADDVDSSLRWRVDTDSAVFSDNTWTHVAITHDGVEPVLYIDGVAVPQTFSTSIDKTEWIGTLAISPNNMRIGNLNYANLGEKNNFGGNIDELYIYNDSLSAERIKGLYYKGLGEHSDAETNVSIRTRTASQYNLSDSSLVSQWSFNADDDGADELGNNDGSCTNCPTWSEDSGIVGGGYNFDGTNDYINVTSALDDLSSTTTGTWSAWVKPVDATPSGTLPMIMSFGDTDADTRLHLDITATGLLRAFLRNSGLNKWVINTKNIVFSDNTWTHVAITHDGVEPVLYVDGVAVPQTFSTSTDKTQWFNDLNGIDNGRIGDQSWNGIGETNYLNGLIDEVRIYNRSLSASEVQDLYELGLSYIDWSWSAYSTITRNDIVEPASHGKFFQYQMKLETNNTEVSPRVFDRTLGFSTVKIPIIDSVNQSINNSNQIDPLKNVTITANISDLEENFDYAYIEWMNSTDSSFTNQINMTNITIKGLNTVVEGIITLPGYEDNITYRVVGVDLGGQIGYSGNYTLGSYYDCTWNLTEELGQIAGWDETKKIGDMIINNTGDINYSGGCSLDFRISYNLEEGRVYYDGESIKNLGYYTVTPGNIQNVSINVSFLSEISQENLAITVDEFRIRSDTQYRDSNATIVSNQAGPYLYQEITSYPSSVYLSSGITFTLGGYLRNLMGDVVYNETNSAYNVTFNWTLPNGFTNSSGNLSTEFLNLTDNNLNSNNVEVGFSSLAGISPGVKTLYLKAQGYNLSGGLIKDASSNTLLSESIDISFLCSSTSDGVYVTGCGSLDGDYVAPATATTTSGGGGGGSSGSSLKSEADYQLVRGEENEVKIEFNNRANETITEISFSVSGDIAKYIKLVPETLDSLGPKENFNLILEITSPGYIDLGRQELRITLSGKKGDENYRDVKRVVLEIHELSGLEAYELLNESQDLLNRLKESNITSSEIEKLYNESVNAAGSFDYEVVRDNFEIIQTQINSALEAEKIIGDLLQLIKVADEKGISTRDTKRLVGLATLSLERQDFSQAYKRAKESQLSYALETKGEIGKITYYLKNYPTQIFTSMVFLFIISFWIFRFSRLENIKRRINRLKREEKLILELIKANQIEVFKNKKMSMGEYRAAIGEYEKRMSSIVKEIIELETKRAHALKITKESKKLKEERKKVIDLIKETQEKYFKKKKIETMIYELNLESYNQRVSEIEEKLSNIEARAALRKQSFNLKELFKGGKKKK